MKVQSTKAERHKSRISNYIVKRFREKQVCSTTLQCVYTSKNSYEMLTFIQLKTHSVDYLIFYLFLFECFH